MSTFTESAKSFLLRGEDKGVEINHNNFEYAVDLHQQQLEELKSLRENIDWEIEESRREFLHQVYPVIGSWKGQFPDLRNIFWPEEIDVLLQDSINQSEGDDRPAGKQFIRFVVLTGYEDEPEVNENGNPQLHRTTPLHHAARRYYCYDEAINSDLFKIYSSFNVNYTDELGFTHLHVACMSGYENVVKKLIDFGHDPNCFEHVKGNSPLHFALTYEHNNLVHLLLRSGACPNSPNKEGSTPLHFIALRKIYDDLADQFFETCDDIKQVVQIDEKDQTGNTALHLAFRFGNLKLIELLLRRGANPNLANIEGSTPLHIICEEEVDDNSLELFFKINDDIQQMVHIDARNNAGNTPMFLAVQNKNYIIVDFLLRRGANPNLVNAEGQTLMHVICETDCDLELAEMIFERSNDKYQPVHVNDRDLNGNTPLHVAAYFRLPLVTEILLRNGANPNLVNNDECTPLHFICKNQNIDADLVKTFIEISKETHQAVQFDIKDMFGDTPLHLAVKDKNLEVVELLLRNGADPDIANEDGLTPLHIICQIRDSKDLLEKFFEINNNIQQTVLVDTRDNWGNAPLHLALRRQNRMAAEVLLRCGANPNSINMDGLTPLHIISMRRCDNDLAKMLFKVSNDVDLTVQLDIQDKSGNTALHLALDHSLEKVAELLLTNGADPNLANREGFTPLHIICQKFCDDDLAELFFKISKERNQPLQIDARDNLGRTPLHLALQYGLIYTAELLLRNGADPNLADLEGLTSLHVICQREGDDNDDELAMIFFKIIDDIEQSVQVDAKDKLGQTPLQLAVSNLKLNVVEILLDRKADLSSFVFPTESRIDKRLQPEPNQSLYNLKLEVAIDALSIIKFLMSRGYELNRTNALRIMTFFTEYELFEMSADIEESWYTQEEFAGIAKEMMIKDDDSGVSLYDLIESLPKVALKQVFIAHSNNFDFVPSGNYDFLSERTNDELSAAKLRESNDTKIMSKMITEPL